MDALHQAMLDILGVAGQIDWSRASVDAMHVRAVKGGSGRAQPVDRGKPGFKIHAVSDRNGLPLTVLVSAANVNDNTVLENLRAIRQPRDDPLSIVEVDEDVTRLERAMTRSFSQIGPFPRNADEPSIAG